MSQETDVSIQRNTEPLLPVFRVHARVHGGGAPAIRANEGLDKGEIWMNLYEFARNSYVIGTNSCLWIGYRLAGFCHFSFWAPFGDGGCVWGGLFT